jgi:hypothetical protein
MSEDLLRATLRERADQTVYDPTPLGAVNTAARAIRRRRRTTGVLVAAAAVVAITVPIAVVANRADPDSAPVEPGPSEPVLTPDGTPSSPILEAEGPPPLVAYAEGQDIIEPGGDTFRVPGTAGISAFASIHGGYLVADQHYFEGTVGLTRYDASGQEIESWTTGGLAMAQDGSVAWGSFVPPESGQTGQTYIHLDDARQAVEHIQPYVAGVVGDEVVFYDRSGAWITDLVSSPRRIPDLGSVSGIAEGRGWMAGQLAELPTQAAVIDIATGRQIWQAPDLQLGQFSPDGRYVLGTVDITHRGGCCSRVVLDAATGTVVARIPQSGANDFPTLSDLTWEDAAHLLGARVNNSSQMLVRFGLDGGEGAPLGATMLSGVPSFVTEVQS